MDTNTKTWSKSNSQADSIKFTQTIGRLLSLGVPFFLKLQIKAKL